MKKLNSYILTTIIILIFSSCDKSENPLDDYESEQENNTITAPIEASIEAPDNIVNKSLKINKMSSWFKFQSGGKCVFKNENSGGFIVIGEPTYTYIKNSSTTATIKVSVEEKLFSPVTYMTSNYTINLTFNDNAEGYANGNCVSTSRFNILNKLYTNSITTNISNTFTLY